MSTDAHKIEWTDRGETTRATVRGYRIKIGRDTDCESPRGYCQNGLIMVGTGSNQARQYSAPDGETLPDELTCKACGGDGYDVDSEGDEGGGDCPTCEGRGIVELTYGRLVAWARETHGATHIIGLQGPSDWAGRWTPTTYNDDETDVDGLIFDTAAKRAETGTTTEQMDEALRGELTEYNAWADGDCYGYAIEDVNGDEVSSCWGFIGLEWCKEAALEGVPDVEAVRTYAVRLTGDQMTAISQALESGELGAMFDAAADKAGR